MADSVSPIERLRRWDERRDSLPGEHWIAAAVGFYLLLRPAASMPGRLLSAGAGALLLARALAGRDGPIATVKALSEQASLEQPDYIDVASPYPYDRRVRISSPRRMTRGSAATTREVGEGVHLPEPS
jgi:hypothetical protein